MVEMVKKILAVEKVKKFPNIIDGSVTVPSLISNMELEDIAIGEMNQFAYCYLLHCMNDDICFNLVDTAKTENLLDGDGALAWKNLLTRYEPKQYGILSNLRREFMTKGLDECEQNPDILFFKLEKICQKISNLGDNSYNDDAMIA